MIKIELDNGKIITKKAESKEIMNVPGLSAGIHSMSSIIGMIEDGAVEEWCVHNPKEETELQKGIKSGKIPFDMTFRMNSTPAVHEEDGRFYLVETDDDWNKVKFYYETEDDLIEDFEYCKNILIKKVKHGK